MGENQSNQSFVQEGGAQNVSVLTNFDVNRLVYVAKKNLLWILVIIPACLLGAYLFMRWHKPIQEASTRVQLEYKSSTDLLDIQLGNFNEGIDAINLAGEIQLIRSDIIFDSAIDSLDIDVSYYAQGDILETEIYRSSPFYVKYHIESGNWYDRSLFVKILDTTSYQLSYYEGEQLIAKQYNFGTTYKVEGFTFTLTKTKNFSFKQGDLSSSYFVINSRAALKNYLLQNMTVEAERGASNTLKISFRDYNKDKVLDIVNHISQSYLRETVINKNRVFEQSLKYLERQLKIANDSLKWYENSYRLYAQVSNKIAEAEQKKELLDKIRNIEDKKLEMRISYQTYQKINDLISADSSASYLVAAASLANNEQLEKLVLEIAEADRALKRVLNYYEQGSAARKQKIERINSMKEELYELVKFNKNFIQDQINDMNKETRRLQSEYFSNETENPELKNIDRNLSIYSNMVTTIINKIIEYNIAKAGTVPSSRVLSKGQFEETPITTKSTIIYLIGLILGVLISFAVIVIKYILHDTINTLKELESFVKTPILGIVPHYSKEALEYSQLIVHLNPKAIISESLRSIRTNLDFINTEKKRIITVTSTISGEGKTFVSINLAGVLAMSGLKVLLLDLDLRKPKVHLAFGMDNSEGVSSVLIGRAKSLDIVQNTPIDTLKCLTAGPIPPNPSELIMSPNFERMVDELKEHFDMIVFDLPPVGLVTDGMLAMKYADLPIYVVRCEYSKITFVNLINNIVTNNKFNKLSVIFNSANVNNPYGYSSSMYGYNYGYGTKHGYYENHPTKQEKKWYQKLFK